MPDSDFFWLGVAQDLVDVVISAPLEDLPSSCNYQVLFLQRKTDEILASEKEMLVRFGKPADQFSDEQLPEVFTKHLAEVSAWLDKQTNFSVIYLDCNAILVDPTKYAL
jgi:hypothetical protein